MIKQIGLPLLGRPILLITRMITDRSGLHSVLLTLFSEHQATSGSFFFNQSRTNSIFFLAESQKNPFKRAHDGVLSDGEGGMRWWVVSGIVKGVQNRMGL